MPQPESVTVPDVERARLRLGRVLAPTPTVHSRQHRAWLKLENLQVTGAYKVRGALNAAMAQLEAGDRRPLVAASAGNHAQGVAWAARHTGLGACVVVPRNAPQTKLAGARALGAEVLVHGDRFEDCLTFAKELAQQRGARLVHAFDDPDVIAGQGTIAFELLECRPDVVVVPIGGGGLASGIGLVLKAHGVRVVGAQVEGVDAMRRALSGTPSLSHPATTIADGLRVQAPGALTRAICARVLDDIVVVSESQVRAAVVRLAAGDKLVAEGAGAVAVAALDRVHAHRAVAIVSGGNIDLETFSSLSGSFRNRQDTRANVAQPPAE